MLTRLTISNYALIDELTVEFGPGFNIMTGETGAGKSIILGALSLILGARADISGIRNSEKKCVVEGAFRVEGHGLEPFFEGNDLDYDHITILRREISPSGKSRAFINDTPVNLQLLRDLTLRLIDIHSQYQNLELGIQQFQLLIVDVVAQNHELLRKYHHLFDEFGADTARLKTLRDKAEKARTELDYFQFQFNQLDDARLQAGEQSELEEEREKLTHSEEIKSALMYVTFLLDGDHFPVIQQLKEALNRLDKIKHFLKDAVGLSDRLQTVLIELQDFARETDIKAEKVEYDPLRLGQITERLDLIYTLQQKHQLSTVVELIDLKDNFARKINDIADYEQATEQLEKKLGECKVHLKGAAQKITNSRLSLFPVIEKKVTEVLRQVGIPNAVFQIVHSTVETFTSTGVDNIRFLFSANKNVAPEEISRIASGGEISRVMLAIKTLLSNSRMLSTIVFDEIDAGISGEIALKIGAILRRLARGMQVINITHLPQIAGMGDHHFLVYKTEDLSGTYTTIRKLSETERIEELAQMLGGIHPSETARKTAREMLQRR
jgi:DNA repair protein RecN (Recombination protein N)